MKNKRKKPDRPVRQISKTNPVFATAINYHRAGRLQEALPIYQQALLIQPENPDLLYSLATLLNQLHQYTGGLEYIRKAIGLSKRKAPYYVLLGDIYRNLGEDALAIEVLNKAMTIDKRLPDPFIILGMIYKTSGQLDEAVNAYQSALKIRADIPEIYNNLGNVYREMNDNILAITSYRKAISLHPAFAGAHHNLGTLLLETGNPAEALASLRNASQLQPDNKLFTASLAGCLGQVIIGDSDNRLADDLLRCITLDRVDGGTLAKNVNVFLKKFSPLRELINSVSQAVMPDFQAVENLELLNDPLLTQYMGREQICDPVLEKFLTFIRAALLVSASENEFQDPGLENFLVAMAHQCFLNEYVYIETEKETCKIRQLAEQINKGSANRYQALLYACYRPLFTLGNDGNSIAPLFDNASDLVQEVWRRQIIEPLNECEIKSKIERLTVINNQTSLTVRQQYEENPYPRWLVTDKPHRTTLTSYLKKLFPCLQERNETLLDEPEILVAGCGTGLQPVRNARRFAYKKITAVDLSLSSLAYGIRKAEESGLNNIRFMQADITELHDHDGRYDFIECFGVLHHLQDPYAGWQILVNLLNTGGVMRIGLYSDQARKAVVAARQFIKEHGYKPLPDDIRHCRQAIFALPEGHPVSVLWGSPDFYTTSECRDLIFHVQEHRLGLQQINDYLQQLGLQFLGFEFPDFHTLHKYHDKYPEDPDATNLMLWDAFEKDCPNTFASQYVFWCRKQ